MTRKNRSRHPRPKPYIVEQKPWIPPIETVEASASHSEEILHQAREEVEKKLKNKNDELDKASKEIGKLQKRLEKCYQEKLSLEKSLRTWEVEAKAGITILAHFFREMDAVLAPPTCPTNGKAAPEVMAEILKHNPLNLARMKMKSIRETILAHSEAPGSDPVQLELRQLVKTECGLQGVHNHSGQTSAYEPPQVQVVVQQPQSEVGYPAFGEDADIADRVRLRNLVDTLQAYFAVKSKLHIREDFDKQYTVVNLSQEWRHQLGSGDIRARVERAKRLLGPCDLDLDARKIVANLAAMEILCAGPKSTYRERGNEIHEPFHPEQYKTSITRYFRHHPDGPTKHEAAAFMAMLPVPPLFRSQLAVLKAPLNPPLSPSHRRNLSV